MLYVLNDKVLENVSGTNHSGQALHCIESLAHTALLSVDLCSPQAESETHANIMHTVRHYCFSSARARKSVPGALWAIPKEVTS